MKPHDMETKAKVIWHSVADGLPRNLINNKYAIVWVSTINKRLFDNVCYFANTKAFYIMDSKKPTEQATAKSFVQGASYWAYERDIVKGVRESINKELLKQGIKREPLPPTLKGKKHSSGTTMTARRLGHGLRERKYK